MIAVANTAIGALLILVGTCGVLHAQQQLVPRATTAPLSGVVEVRIGAVLASNSGNEFDQRLAALHRQFETLFAYSSYRLVKEQNQLVPWGAKVGFDMPGGRYVLVIPREFKDERIVMKVILIDGSRPIIDTAVSLRNHATFLLGGPRQRDGVLILSIGAGTRP